jgi:hypothetical protein
MLPHMRTSIDISDALLADAKRLAKQRGITLKQLVEEGLARVVAATKTEAPFVLRDATFRGPVGFAPGAGPESIAQEIRAFNGGRALP